MNVYADDANRQCRTLLRFPARPAGACRCRVRDDADRRKEPGREAPLWRRTVPSRAYLQWGRIPAPLLVGASILKARDDNQRRWLRIEAVDPATGLQVGFADRLPEMRLYQCRLRRRRRRDPPDWRTGRHRIALRSRRPRRDRHLRRRIIRLQSPLDQLRRGW